ncbi:uncharacterized protein H6S33_001210 [Morchella sextelata]|uniref:uncharacterized protein n=1 Tax=Morchella sextelata TaxID=1174677 RepID=UPI001D048035|nr:uncharacterized protein H6S33_001210 [Morchella sextelata]KAH0608982.1 hypothetical protein H6S33_001210 [Morchella sextelata]
MATVYISRPSSGDWERDLNITLQSQENLERLWQTIQSVRLGTITPSSAAMTCFTWLTDIINGRCPPFYPEAEAEAAAWRPQPGDTPGMRVFHEHLCGFLWTNSGLSDDERQDLLLEFMVEYWRLLRTKKWIYRGETMELLSLGREEHSHGPHHWPHTDGRLNAPRPEGIPCRLYRDRQKDRFQALIGKHMGFSWVKQSMSMYNGIFEPFNASGPRFKEQFKTMVITFEIFGRELYTSPCVLPRTRGNYEDRDTGIFITEFEYIGSGVGEYRKRWPEWIARGQVLMADESYSKEFKEVVRRVVEVMKNIEETVKKEEDKQRAVEVEAKAGANAG